mmetsp:Transcript_98562/g.257575  ORF Transcript_98562/g.257575 Transcript_98562/m.257575 type:complete len:237 (-) Transcript_98562:367-1077(-)
MARRRPGEGHTPRQEGGEFRSTQATLAIALGDTGTCQPRRRGNDLALAVAHHQGCLHGRPVLIQGPSVPVRELGHVARKPPAEDCHRALRLLHPGRPLDLLQAEEAGNVCLRSDHSQDRRRQLIHEQSKKSCENSKVGVDRLGARALLGGRHSGHCVRKLLPRDSHHLQPLSSDLEVHHARPASLAVEAIGEPSRRVPAAAPEEACVAAGRQGRHLLGRGVPVEPTVCHAGLAALR